MFIEVKKESIKNKLPDLGNKSLAAESSPRPADPHDV
jgi:hypothetical protein